MLKIYDCSNSSERPKHRQISLCPKENDIVRDLKANAYLFGCDFIIDYRKADVIFTNDVFPKHLINSKKFKVKRMDGIFWREDLIKRNKVLNYSAQKADWVIFISWFSALSYSDLYQEPFKNHTVILNNVNGIFRCLREKVDDINNLKFSACASNWEREEKRFTDLMLLANHIKDKIYLIGKCKYKVPKNVIKLGYINDYHTLNYRLNLTDGFINLSYRDPAPKVVCQAVACGLPILYADSGGTGELVHSGIGICDEDVFDIRKKSPRLLLRDMMDGYSSFIRNYLILDERARQVKRNYYNTLNQYFNIFKLA